MYGVDYKGRVLYVSNHFYCSIHGRSLSGASQDNFYFSTSTTK